MPEWCTISEVEYQLSVDGVSGTTNDNHTNYTADPAIVNSAIVNARLQLSQYLVQKYDIATITSANEWVKWATSTFAAVELLRRKGGVVPPGLQEKYEELKVFLESVQTGIMIVPGLAPRTMGGMALTNMTIDNRYGRAKIRRVSSISFPTTSGTSLGSFTDRNDYGVTQ